VRRVLLVCAALLLAVGTLHAQGPQVQGRVIGPDGEPLADTRVVLHRVVGMGGANIAEAVSDSAGRFTISADSAPSPEAVYFLAARYQGELYIGEAFRAPFATTEYVLSVGVPGTSASALIGEGQGTALPQGAPATSATRLPGSAPATSTRWLLFAIPAIMLLGVVAYFVLRRRTSIPPRRRILADLAALDLEHAGSTDPDALRAYHERRAALITQVHALDE
jgi:hypothetical protein